MSVARSIILALVLLAIFIALIVYGVLKMTAPARELSREFFFALSNGDLETVRALNSDSLNAEFSDARLTGFSDAMAPFADFRFNNLSWENGRFAATGTGWTDSGCISALSINRFGGKVTAFQVEPICAQ